MRVLPSDISTRLNKPVQTKATNADPQLSFIISRKTTQLTDAEFMEQSEVAEANATDCSIAIKHSRFGRDSDAAYVAYVQNGMAKVASSPTCASAVSHTWTDKGFAQSATAVAIAFNGTMPRNVHGRYEFITEDIPWVFWIAGGAVYGTKLGGSAVVLAEQNATDISAVRAMWSDVPGFDFGLVLFILIAGSVYYRQLIGGIWSNAELIPAASLPSGKTWTQISAQRTWDYRVALQILSDDGSLYELFTQFEGIGSKNAEHINLSDVTAQGAITDIIYTSANENEHIGIPNVQAVGSFVYGKTSTPVGITNINDGTGNWGLRIQIVFNYPIHNTSGNHTGFILTDGGNINYSATGLTLSEDGLALTVDMSDFNLAAYNPNCVMKYSPGTIQSPAVTLEAFNFEFIPVNLIAPPIDPPAVLEIHNE